MFEGNDRKTGTTKARESSEKKFQRYLNLCHAVQSGIAWTIAKENPEVFDINQDPNLCAHKHLRTGIDTSKSDLGALAALLIRKKLITHEEYVDVLVEFMENEVAMYEKKLSELYGKKITLA